MPGSGPAAPAADGPDRAGTGAALPAPVPVPAVGRVDVPGPSDGRLGPLPPCPDVQPPAISATARTTAGVAPGRRARQARSNAMRAVTTAATAGRLA